MIGCGIFVALCGSSPATAAAIGGIGIPEMRRRGYSPALAAGLIAHGGTFGILIPPSVTMILYGSLTKSIGKCFIAESFLESCSCCSAVHGWERYSFTESASRPSPGHVYYIEVEHQKDYGDLSLAGALRGPHPCVTVYFDYLSVLMGSLYGGWATPSEAAAVGAVLSLFCVMAIYRIYRPQPAVGNIRQGPEREHHDPFDHGCGPDFCLGLVTPVCHPDPGRLILKLPWANGGSSFSSMFSCCFSAVLYRRRPDFACSPLALPIVRASGFDPIWFAVIMTVNLEIGLITPPVGLNLYVVQTHCSGYSHVPGSAGAAAVCVDRLPAHRNSLYLA